MRPSLKVRLSSFPLFVASSRGMTLDRSPSYLRKCKSVYDPYTYWGDQMAEFKMIVEEKPDADAWKEIVGQLVKFNESKAGPLKPERFVVTLRDPESNAVIGGLHAVSYWDWFFIEHVYVPDALRKRGTGTSLMKEAEAAAKKRGCVGINLGTFSFQAPGFYEKLGYERTHTTPHFPKGHENYTYVKRLDT